MTPTQYSQNLLNRIPVISSTGAYTRSGLQEDNKVFDINSKASLDVSDGFGIAPLYEIPAGLAGWETFNDT